MISKSSTHIGSLEGISITRLTGCAKMVTLCNECHLDDDNDNDDDENGDLDLLPYPDSLQLPYDQIQRLVLQFPLEVLIIIVDVIMIIMTIYAIMIVMTKTGHIVT